ncbi:hypothetical protein FTUN_4508 [Frigoriglobus tundricola]|uniref:Uncharacterized protein n=1 Tax=Frigoriglobus tundricola TaxID=2774151 RepID=A0A6M5YSH4_9BACT|nr:hypothetical protein FTUN_4508 [Frigoriglobus tundricola]
MTGYVCPLRQFGTNGFLGWPTVSDGRWLHRRCCDAVPEELHALRRGHCRRQ